MAKKRKNTLVQRLNIIQGQINGLSTLLDKEADCRNVTNQFYAIESALKKVMEIYFKKNLTECLRNTTSQTNKERFEFLLREIFRNK